MIAGSLFSLLILPSCASPSGISANISNLVARGEYARAKSFLEKNRKNYGKNNTLLYYLDEGMLLHLSGDHAQSNRSFEQAKREYEKLYTRSVVGIIGSWMFNDYAAPYSGEDFERVLINVFESLNYAMINDLQGALVEARDVNEKLRLINDRYGLDAKNAYREDAFARLLAGLLYEASLKPEGYNDAFISYARSAEIYESDYHRLYQVETPRILKENVLAAAQFMGKDQLEHMRARYGEIPFYSLVEKSKKAEIYLVQYNGPAPTKSEFVMPIPLPDGNIVTLPLVQYDRRYPEIRYSQLTAISAQDQAIEARTELVENINAIAAKVLESKRARIIAKAVVTSAGKYVLEKALQQQINKKFGTTAEMNAILLSSLFNIYTNRPDLRSWQTLPSEIRLARLLVEPGEYSLSIAHFDFQDHLIKKDFLPKVNLGAGDKKFFVVRTD